jgi:phosphoglycerol transferase MdoB-like AlkP superfamily enzyme
MWLAAILVAARLATTAIAQIDWASILQTAIALAEAVLVFGVFLELLAAAAGRAASWRRLVVAPLAALIALYAMPLVSGRLADATGDSRLAAAAILDRLPAHDPLASFAAGRLIEQDSFDVAFYQGVIATEQRQSTLKPAPRHVAAPVAIPAGASPPNILFIVVDSLRRDYLSAYNPAVTFTPKIGAWARESFVFRNAFTPYGGTWLAMPAIWTGTALTRGWAQIFDRINTLQAVITGGNYEFVINDFTVATNLTAARTFLDPEIPSLETDLCRNLQSLRRHTENRPPGSRPLFVYLAPMNIHILNTQGGERGTRYRGFYEPYAGRVERVDGCFGEFIEHYKRQGLYDNSIVVLTSDHGDLLGEDGRWGHQFHLFPQAIRIPMIVSLPARWRSAYTTDLARISFLTDLAPSLQALLGASPPQGEGIVGSPLFVAPDEAPAPRRRESFLVMSSYGSTYGLLRRNGRFLYVSDLLNWRDHAYELFQEPNGAAVPVTGALRRVNQAGIEQQLDRVDRMFKRP